MSLHFKDKVSIVTGGSRGIGIAIAAALAKEGSSLVLAARNGSELESAKKELGKHGTRIETFCGDVSNPGQARNLADFTLRNFGTIDILVNCAGVYGPIGLATDVDEEAWFEALRINVCGTFFCIKQVLPAMIAKKSGKIINLSGGGGASPFPRFSAYSASKAAVIRLTETLAEEVKEHQIDVNAIAPGPVNTRFLDQVLQAGEAAGNDFLTKSMKQKKDGGTSPERVAELAVFLASSKSNGLTGRLISVLWDNWKDIPSHLDQLSNSDVYTLRRIVPHDRGYTW